MRSRQYIFLNGGGGWDHSHSGWCLLLRYRWGSGGVSCYGSRVGPLDRLFWCGWPMSAAGSLRWCDSHCRVSDCQCLGQQKARRQPFMALIIARPGQGCHSHTLWSSGFFAHLCRGSLFVLQMDAVLKVLLASETWWRCFVKYLCW